MYLNLILMNWKAQASCGNFLSLIKVTANSVYANPALERPAVAQIHGMKLHWNIYMVLDYMV